mmetsp:Transcript_5913/g.8942  ORF Transcript_5913/g.8942 Transcript_5913/m.8942 type:complete len:246 (-) Transcript_5913:61-798(-)|eukprot:CAMPEP_0117013356 /NCGR_PEP_ID=MMETSP0472-20121206/11039_1 /TAXON_ID=693140 ORGANISM="Tiarina fusus, Strain LIS" /NCGR_SAMPLE_ID=MMETSP0472 /ASSEMBLY_ACC=CAM_ASM_000603 /LENGTH=245 /DNA_ID=CAMNT_0004716649 /DNA_START=86 /DNA_END=823 /DNA_ORIENTATION=-
MSSDRTEPLYVLYGSQMGNSEEAAQTFCKELEKRYTPDFFKANELAHVNVETICIQLDDFLEMHHAKFTKLLVVFVSSYGVGQAPLGAYRFREVCEAWKEDDKKPLDGLKYAICGLGDSSYPTFLKNPVTIDEGLTAAGAVRIGDLAKADANAVGDKAQDKVISAWIDGMMLPVAKALADDKQVDVAAMQKNTIPLLCKLDPDYTPPVEEKKKQKKGLLGFMGLASVLAGVAIAISLSSIVQGSE